MTGRGAFRTRRIDVARRLGEYGKANVGISNDNGGEKPPRRKTQAS